MHLYNKAIELTEQGRPFALATVIKASGSTPQKAGAKAIFEPAGAIWGTLGGGCLEAESRVRALRALDDGKAAVFDLSLDEDYGWDDGLICGGRVRVFVDPHAHRHYDVYRIAMEAVLRRQPGVIITQVSDASGLHCGDLRWLGNEELATPGLPWSAEALLAAIAAEKSLLWTNESGDGEEVYVEPLAPAPRLIIAGGGHIGQALARLADFLGFVVTVVDDRPAFTKADLYPFGVTTVCADIPSEIGSTEGGQDAFFVIVTRGHRHDGKVLAACIHKEAAYLGLIGSKRKILLIRKQFLEQGVASEEGLNRVRSPMGLDIGSVTVPEIATSIAAELVAVRRKANAVGAPLSLRHA